MISNDSCNAHGARVVVLPITSNVTSLYPGEALIHVRGRRARVLGDQIRSIDKARLRARIGSLKGTIADGGGPFENDFLATALVVGGHIQRYEILGDADAERAVARFEELCAARITT